jgi:decaprenylphospho-beta-D-ribofuranose 2-oxidase
MEHDAKASVLSFDRTEDVATSLSRPERYEDLFQSLSAPGVISRGSGLNYCMASGADRGHSVLSNRFDRFLAFDEGQRTVRVEPGVTMGDLLEFAVSRNLLPPVLPGYPLVTTGGAIAANIHGKNQFHVGTFGDHVRRLTLYHPQSGEIVCSRDENPGIFGLTLGGFGLTGHITSADIALAPLSGRTVEVERHHVRNLSEAVHVMEKLSERIHYMYSWHNLNLRGQHFGAGMVYAEHHWDREARAVPRKPVPPRPFPWCSYNGLTVPLLCRCYQIKERLARAARSSPLYPAFFPFSGSEWYFRLYGHRGLREYQLLIPTNNWEQACGAIERAMGRCGSPVMLASLKLFRGERKFVNFSGSGVCLALDTPNTPNASSLFSCLDEITIAHGGIANLSKDGRLSAATVRAMYGGAYEAFRRALQEYDPRGHYQSKLRERLEF